METTERYKGEGCTLHSNVRNRRRTDIESQEFNGKIYHRYKGERYFSRGTHRLHRVVWEFYNGEIPEGCHIHHKDENPANNAIENLELMQRTSHLSLHSQERIKDEGELKKMRENMAKACECAKAWHHSEEGRKWHSQHSKEQCEKRKPRKFLCDCCGKEFETKNIRISGNHFCSNNCKSKYRRIMHFDDEKRICPCCGKEFIVNKYSKQIYCGRSCGKKHKSKK